MKLIIDRLEGDFAVAELPNGKMEVCPKAIFPDDVQEGNIIELYIDKKATEEKKNSVKSKMNKLFRD